MLRRGDANGESNAKADTICNLLDAHLLNEKIALNDRRKVCTHQITRPPLGLFDVSSDRHLPPMFARRLPSAAASRTSLRHLSSTSLPGGLRVLAVPGPGAATGNVSLSLVLRNAGSRNSPVPGAASVLKNFAFKVRSPADAPGVDDAGLMRSFGRTDGAEEQAGQRAQDGPRGRTRWGCLELGAREGVPQLRRDLPKGRRVSFPFPVQIGLCLRSPRSRSCILRMALVMSLA